MQTVSDVDQESGFLFLQDCDLSFMLASEGPEGPSRQKDENIIWPSSFQGRWFPLHFSQHESEQKSKPDPSFPDSCPHCRLTIECRSCDSSSGQPASFIAKGPTPRFDGTTTDLKPSEIHCTCGVKLRQRTDGALLLGLALACQDMGHISIRSIKVFLRTLDCRNVKDVSTRNRQRASLAITVYVPEIHVEQTQFSSPDGKSRRRRNLQGPPRKRFISNSSKLLPPATQLLLSILRSDWTFLNDVIQNPGRMAHMEDGNTTLGRSLSFFPSKLALDEVYQRIGGATTSFLDCEESFLPFALSKSNLITCMDLPKDVWQYHIGSFLKARSLDSLRCASKYFHRILQEVVPGLRLRLYTHQVKSLLWMRLRETKIFSERELARHGMAWEDDIHNAATGGATVLLRNRTKGFILQHYAHRISQHNGEEVILRSDDPLSRSVARGGLLCDDPGLGKTITVMSLILQTLGLSTSSVAGSGIDDVIAGETEAYKERIFREYWREQSIPQFRSQALNKLLSTFIRNNDDTTIFVFPVRPEEDGVPDYFEVISNPICFQDIRKRINNFSYDLSFPSFQADVIQCFRNAIIYHPRDSEIYRIAKRLERKFLESVDDFKQNQVQSAKKSFGRASSKPNSSVAALVALDNKVKLHNALIQSSGTLLVVPSVLLEHWQDQLRRHVDMAYCTSKHPIIFEFTGTAENNLRLEEIVRECQVANTHTPFLFVDKTGTRMLPSPQFLAMFAIVITTIQRFTNEWKNGSFEDELRQGESKGIYDNEMEHDLQAYLTKSEEACPLLKINWLRMIVDEGHSMGRGKENSAILFASWISSERRWVMTGTPTRQVVSQSGLSSLLNLMNYLQHDFFSHRQDGNSSWQNLIARGWSRGMLSAFFRLRRLLELLMVRHTKFDIKELPLPRHHSKILPMSLEETKTYNTLVCGIQSNLAITSMKGKTSGLQDSLLHRSQGRHARDALRNVRLVCAGGTQVIPTITENFWKEFLDDFAGYNPDPKMKEKMKEYLSRATAESVSPCECCGTLLTTLLVIPCGDLVCTECFDPQSDHCIVCNKQFDIDVFQKLQPGLDYQWLHNIEEEAKCNKGNGEMIENEVSERHSPIELLHDGRGVLAPLDTSVERRRTAKPGDGHKCVYNPKQVNGACEKCWKEHDYCNLMTATGRCQVCYRTASPCPAFETKPSYVVQKLLALHDEQRKRQEHLRQTKTVLGDCHASAQMRSLKLIVFSQFRTVLNAVGDRLIRRCGTACIAEYWGQYRKQELHKFIYDDQCFCMLLGKDGSEGLDLSFVTHIIFLEQVWDKSLEQQVVARAWRMGAKGSVEVETLVAEGSVEELMGRLEANLQSGTQQSLTEMQGMQYATEAGKGSEYQRAKLHFLLKNLRLITSSATNPLARGSSEAKRRIPTAKQESYRDAKTKRRRYVNFDI